MARLLVAACLAAALAVSCRCHDAVEQLAPAPAPTPTPAMPQSLSTSSRWIVDERGRRVKLACVNWPSHLEPAVAEGLAHRPVGAIAVDIAAMGFNCVRLTWPTFLATGDAAYGANLTVANSLRRLNLTAALAGVAANNPGMADLPLADALVAVVRALAASGVMVVLDNHVSRPGWCCRADDGNGFFGDADFDPDVWIRGLTKMAALFAGEENVVAMSLRNELRGRRQNTDDWYRYMQRGAEAVHAANPRVLVILSGLNNDNDLSFLRRRPVHLTFPRKLAFEVHWYSFSDPHQWSGAAANPNRVCARIAASVSRRALYLLDRGHPVVLSEFGVDNRGGNAADNRYWGCAAAAAAGLDLDWALWALTGSYYLRQGVAGHDEAYGVLDHEWRGPRNATALRRLHALQRPFRGPGIDGEAAPYTVLFHPATGRCVVRRSPEMVLELGACNETAAAWEYNREHRLVLRDSLVSVCLRADGAGRPVRLGVGRAGCAGAQARWLLESESKLHVAVHVPAAAANSRVEKLCLDVGEDGRSLVSNRCRCLSSGGCDPESQWFKMVKSTRKVASGSILGQLLLAMLENLKIWLFRHLANLCSSWGWA